MRVSMNIDACRLLGLLIKRLRLAPSSFTDARFYPSLKCSADLAVNYFFFMVAIDHRTGFEGVPFEGLVEGEMFSGAMLLWRLGKLKFDEDPEFFTPKRMVSVTASEVADWLKVEKPYPREVWDPDVRAFLLRDAATRLVEEYGGSALNLIRASRGFLFNNGEGLVERLRKFRAYEDPVGKKSFLLVKFLERRAFISIVDEDNLEVPVDNHLSRVALRLGLVSVDEDTLDKIMRREEFTPAEDYAMRMRIKEAYKLTSAFAKIKPTLLDDFLWLLGKTCCSQETPVCAFGCSRDRCPLLDLIGDCRGECILAPVCRARSDPKLQLLPEHKFTNTWYY
ncbi:MAG: hypothetical protein DRJ26_01510 [Candidatus Methanomethylicota archaeon]|uniref:Iron-sulfur cluster loop n=1 Tax=Thermoproteota archaeon TaxID=2056631 RepID=A0A497F661_9CREN|nr:MAG: hypothetical protein DRJ26_01510 [Candidatus Verstraetearchaeota archaeon]